MAAAADAGTKQRSRSWTERELKYFAFVLPDEENDFGYKLDTLALKKTTNKTVFEEIKKILEESMSIEEFKEENISSFILYWQLKNSSSAFLLQENNFTSSSRAAILNFTALSDWTGNVSSSIKTATVFTVFLLTLRKPRTESIQSAPS